MPRSKKRPAKCLSPGCGGKAYSRGLCRSCYQAALRDVGLNKTTWAALEKIGLSKEAKSAHRRRRTPIGKVIDELAASRG